MWLKICDCHLTCKVANKCLNVRERMEVVEWNKRWSPPFPCCPVNHQCLWKKTLIEKNLIFKIVSCMQWLGYLPNMSLELVFDAHFLHDFSIICSLFNTLPMDKVSMSYLFSFSRYETKCVYSDLDNWWCHKLLRVIFDYPLSNGQQAEGGRMEIFTVFEGLSFGDEIKNSRHKLWWKYFSR